MLLNKISVSHRQEKNLYGSQKINISHVRKKRCLVIQAENLKQYYGFMYFDTNIFSLFAFYYKINQLWFHYIHTFFKPDSNVTHQKASCLVSLNLSKQQPLTPKMVSYLKKWK